MSCPLSAVYAVIALLTASEPAPAALRASPTASSDSAAEAVVLDEVRAFYRDLDERNWVALLDHFLPSKVTARWVPPRDSGAWVRLEAPSPTPDGVASESGRCAPRAAVVVVGDWARARVRRCGAALDEAWLLRVSGHWKIVYLELAPPPAV